VSAVCDEEIVVILRSRPDSLLTAFCVLVFSTVNSCPPVSPAVP